MIIFLCLYYWENVYQAKLKECILRQNWKVYITTNVFHLKLPKITFYENIAHVGAWENAFAEKDFLKWIHSKTKKQ